MEHRKVHKVVIAGGGTAGWMAAASLAKLLGKTLDITVVESDEIGTVGVGEATIPTLQTLHELLKIKEQDFVRAVQGTFKLGISFENWRDIGRNYIHSFGWTGQDSWAAGFQHFWLKGRRMGISREFGEYCKEWVAAKQRRFAVLPNHGLNYAYHFDASLYARFLRTMAEEHGAVRREGRIEVVEQDPATGFITGLRLQSGQLVPGDLFIDCTGLPRLADRADAPRRLRGLDALAPLRQRRRRADRVVVASAAVYAFHRPGCGGGNGASRCSIASATASCSAASTGPTTRRSTVCLRMSRAKCSPNHA